MKFSNKPLPFVSAVIPTYNSSRIIEKCLHSILKQDYPKSKLEIIIVDGGSTDSTISIVSKFKVKLIYADPKKQNVEYNKSIGIEHAKGDLLLMLDHDNILPNKDTLQKMVKPFTEIDDLVASETLHYKYDKRASLINRYIALFGVTDPVAYYLGKADRMSYHTEEYDKKYKPEKRKGYFLVRFSKKNLPTVGANGFLVNKEILKNNAKISPRYYFHIDVNVDLINKGYNKYAFVNDSILHLGGDVSLNKFFLRRMKFMKQFFSGDNKTAAKRRYKIYKREDRLRLVYFILISITFIIPLIDSMRGYLRIKDKAWFLHPVICFGFVLVYGYVILEHYIVKSCKHFLR